MRLEGRRLVLSHAGWWAHWVGVPPIRGGQRRRGDRPGRRNVAVVRLGGAWRAARLDRGHPPQPGRLTTLG